MEAFYCRAWDDSVLNVLLAPMRQVQSAVLIPAQDHIWLCFVGVFSTGSETSRKLACGQHHERDALHVVKSVFQAPREQTMPLVLIQAPQKQRSVGSAYQQFSCQQGSPPCSHERVRVKLYTNSTGTHLKQGTDVITLFGNTGSDTK